MSNREFTGKFESSNVSRDNVSREIRRMFMCCYVCLYYVVRLLCLHPAVHFRTYTLAPLMCFCCFMVCVLLCMC